MIIYFKIVLFKIKMKEVIITKQYSNQNKTDF